MRSSSRTSSMESNSSLGHDLIEGAGRLVRKLSDRKTKKGEQKEAAPNELGPLANVAWRAQSVASALIASRVTPTSSRLDLTEPETVNREAHPVFSSQMTSSAVGTQMSDMAPPTDPPLHPDNAAESAHPGVSELGNFSLGASYKPHIPVLQAHKCDSAPDLTGRITKIDGPVVFAGTISTVFPAKLDGGILVAVKGLRAGAFNYETIERKFRRETATWWCLQHENILPLYGYVREPVLGSFAGLVSPWCRHGTSTDYLQKHGASLKVADRLRLFFDVANGIHYLHTFRPTIVHGDLKPVNVLIGDDGVAKICDFGLLSLLRGENETKTGVTTKSAYTGTTRYLSYELVAEEERCKISTASDVHALACVGMEFVYSKHPYDQIPSTNERADFRIMRAIEDRKPPAVRPDDAVGSISALWDLFEQAWNLDPSARPSAHDICQFLTSMSATISEEWQASALS